MKRVILAILLLLAALNVCSCSGGSEAVYVPEDKTETAPTEKYVAIYPLSSYEYFIDHKLGFFQAGSNLGVEVEYLGPEDNDIEAMKTCMNTAIEQEVNGIVLFGASDELAESVNRAWDKGIPCVTVDGDVKGSKRLAFVGTGNFSAGETLAQTAVDLLKGKGSIAIMTELGTELHVERTAGCRSVLDKYSGITVRDVVDTKADTTVSYEAAKGLLRKYGTQLDLILVTDAIGGPALAAAVEDMGYAGKIKLITMDRGSYVLQKIDDGVIAATVVQQTALMPYYAMRVLYDYNHPSVTIVSDRASAGVKGVPDLIEMGVYVIDKDNYEYFDRY